MISYRYMDLGNSICASITTASPAANSHLRLIKLRCIMDDYSSLVSKAPQMQEIRTSSIGLCARQKCRIYFNLAALLLQLREPSQFLKEKNYVMDHKFHSMRSADYSKSFGFLEPDD
jgi:hypothetical protein